MKIYLQLLSLFVYSFLIAQEKILKDYVIPNEKFDSLNNVWIEEPVPFVEVYEEIIDNKLTGKTVFEFSPKKQLILNHRFFCSSKHTFYIAWNDSTLVYFIRFANTILECKTYKYSIEKGIVEPVRTNYTEPLLGPRPYRSDGRIQDIRILSGDMILIGDEIKQLSRYQRKLLYLKDDKLYLYDL
ncbi:MAG: hypothetical protein IPL35_13200 [Sphingobacteriales bacterium]|nr:hypothetical protein [Sphingobacteriales bacterium]